MMFVWSNQISTIQMDSSIETYLLSLKKNKVVKFYIVSPPFITSPQQYLFAHQKFFYTVGS